MRLTDHDLKQLHREYLATLSKEQLLFLSGNMLDDLRDARDRLNQTPQNSSRPSGSYAPWEQATRSGEDNIEQPEAEREAVAQSKEGSEKGQSEKLDKSDQKKKASDDDDDDEDEDEENEPEKKRKAGKQKGAKGFGRRVELAVTDIKIHKATHCSGCGDELADSVPFEAKTGLYVLDIEKETVGLAVTHVKHIYGERRCVCGHKTQTMPGRCEDDPAWDVALTEWHLVGPMLSSLIICQSMRMRLSRSRIREFLHDWLGITLSVGCINQCIAEGGRACAALEEELIAEIQQSELLYADETGWKEHGRTVWLWVLKTATTTLYLIGRRSWDVIATVMEKFAGWLMSDGYGQYRKYAKRLRCLAHIIRKARGLADSCHPSAALFGEKVLSTLSLFIAGIYEARGDPTLNLMERFAQHLTDLNALCEQHRDHEHEKTKKLARELLNDWDAIWQVLSYPQLPITNNTAEQALRHWVIARKISFGTRTKQGSRAYALLASVIDTCRQRGVLPWPYIANVIGERRQGKVAPPLPQLV